MKIANPIYDKAFKYLMQNEKLAKKLIGIILDQEVLSLEYKTQEVVYHDEKRNLPLLRMDFNAVILNEKGEELNVLIEIQKSNNPNPVVRFRKYLGSAYLKTVEKEAKTGEKVLTAKPIITIYILGYSLPDLDYAAVMVDNKPYNILTKEPIAENEFIKLLTHKSYIIQIDKTNPKPNTRLEKLLSLFDQNKKSETDYILDLPDDNYEEINEFKQYLHLATQNEELIKQLELEQEMEIHLNNIELRLQKAEKEKKQVEKERLQEQEIRIKAEQEKQKAEQEKQKAEKEKQKAEQDKKQANIKLAQKMKKYGEPIDEIIKETGLTKKEIEKLG